MRILIIEDEKYLADALVQILTQNKYSADAVYNGEDGLDYALSGIYDIILLDIMLPKLNGLEVLKNLREKGLQTPIMLLTAKGEVSDKVSGLDHGADDYLTKPFVTEELLARLRALSRRRGDLICDDSLHFKDLTLNLSTYELSSSTKSIKLGLKEFHILEFLISHGEHVVSKEELLEKIWGYDSDAEYNHVEVYISFLRKKLLHLQSKVSIQTQRGVGYYLEGERHD
ncbi:DNA-binding response regulator [Sporanaerobium hydrogeniformans]|uniref:DNA-binding response regulator n=1 Tax=Sporanaerobium hydrogeniformans TaxID=3072179 RepID=A0AC61D6H0_9FIRM|nr:response regulator transcription factor [Sporanaerobium hydrogeniformans]PHV69269.1 DNA-binding response regulator [Sporanaerobium hydrogeniformans]